MRMEQSEIEEECFIFKTNKETERQKVVVVGLGGGGFPTQEIHLETIKNNWQQISAQYPKTGESGNFLIPVLTLTIK